MSASKLGRLVVVDAIDGAGKTTAINGLADYLAERGHDKQFDLVDFQQRHHRLPELEELGDAEVLLAAEPTYSWIGAGIREELVKTHKDRSYSGMSAVRAFALDREILYKRVIIPFLATSPKHWVIQDRGLITSLAYQPLQDPSVDVSDVLMEPGNLTELSCPPDLLCLLTLDVSIAQNRLEGRKEKQDDHIFETKDFQRALAERYMLDEVRDPFADTGSVIVEIDASKTPGYTIEQIRNALANLFKIK